jgi:hypothetical protein
MQPKTIKALKAKMAQALNDDIKHLSKDLQDILLDDLVTTFENRLTVLKRSRLNDMDLQCLVDVEMTVSQ